MLSCFSASCEPIYGPFELLSADGITGIAAMDLLTGTIAGKGTLATG
jgi:hypothetical protein